MTIPHHRPVTFDLMADDDTYFVLTDALREFAARQRWEAGDDPTGNAESRVQWAECAERLLDRIEQAMSQAANANTPEHPPAADRAALRSELEGLVQDRRTWEETARACVCTPGLCSRRDFRDHAVETAPSSCMVCADLNSDRPCYMAVVRSLRTLAQARR